MRMGTLNLQVRKLLVEIKKTKDDFTSVVSTLNVALTEKNHVQCIYYLHSSIL